MTSLLRRKSLWILTHDVLAVCLSFLAALWLRLGDDVWEIEHIFPAHISIVALVGLVVLLGFRIANRIWEYTSIPDLIRILRMSLAVIAAIVIALFLYNRLLDIPRTTFVIQWLLMISMLGGSRLSYRLFFNRRLGIRGLARTEKISALLVGVNQHSEAFLRDIVGNPTAEYRVIGIVSKDGADVGRYVRNVRVLSDVAGIERAFEYACGIGMPIQKLVISPDELSGEQVKSLLAEAAERGMTVEQLTRLTDFAVEGVGKKQSLRPIALEDLLGRPQNVLDRQSMLSMIKGKRVLVTGAGGTIGSELVRQIAGFAPEHMTLIDASEYHLYRLRQDLAALPDAPEYRTVITDIRNQRYMEHLFEDVRPEIVFHAAALKHVPLSEENVVEAISTNVFGSRILADLCVAHKVAAMVMISTDKAVNPSSVMGATKRLAEQYVQALSQSAKGKSVQFTTIRFGNVLGSSGSVIPLFQRQLAAGGPLTVTHPDMRRYFMTVREAVELVIEAASLVQRGKLAGDTIFVLDMNEPVYIKDLAEQVIRLSGLKPYDDIDIEFTGMRPGEKLFEELFHGNESPVKTDYAGILIATTREVALKQADKQLKALAVVMKSFDGRACIAKLQEFIPEFDHQD